MDAQSLALKHGITLRSSAHGTRKMTCPKCSHNRKNKSDLCLSVRIDKTGVGWRCFNCNWTGGELSDAFKATSSVAHKKSNHNRDGGSYGSLHRAARSGWISN